MPGFGGGGLEQTQRAFPVALAVGEFGQQAQGVAVEGIGVEGPLGQLADVGDAGPSAASGLSAGAWRAAVSGFVAGAAEMQPRGWRGYSSSGPARALQLRPLLFGEPHQRGRLIGVQPQGGARSNGGEVGGKAVGEDQPQEEARERRIEQRAELPRR